MQIEQQRRQHLKAMMVPNAWPPPRAVSLGEDWLVYTNSRYLDPCAETPPIAPICGRRRRNRKPETTAKRFPRRVIQADQYLGPLIRNLNQGHPTSAASSVGYLFIRGTASLVSSLPVTYLTALNAYLPIYLGTYVPTYLCNHLPVLMFPATSRRRGKSVRWVWPFTEDGVSVKMDSVNAIHPTTLPRYVPE